MILPIYYDVDITQPLLPAPIQPMLITKDALANRIGVRLFEGKTPYIPGGTCAGFAVRRDGYTVPITGAINGNEMYIDLPAAAYALDGPINIGIKNVQGSAETTVFLGMGTVTRGETDTAIDPGTIIPSVAALIAEIEETRATIPMDYSALSAAVRALQALPTDTVLYGSAQSLTDAQKTQARGNIGAAGEDDVTALKNDMKNISSLPGDNLLPITAISEAAIAVTYVTDAETGKITITNSSNGSYACVQTADTFGPANMTPGATYRLHAKAVKVSGSPNMRVAIRGVSGNANGIAKVLNLNDAGEGYIDFVADQYMKRVTLFVSYGSSTANSICTFSDISLQVYDINGKLNDARITAAEGKIDDLEDQLEETFHVETCVNLFDKSNAVYGKYMNPATGNEVAQADHFYVYFPAVPGTYRFYSDYTLFGSAQVKYIPVFNANKTYRTYITGSHFGDETGGNWYGITFTITNAHVQSGYAWFAVSQRIDNMERFMLVKDINYPAEYIPYFKTRTVLQDVYVQLGYALGTVSNRLYEKTACFFGDSICNGSSARDTKNGWAGRIGDTNTMTWVNYGVNGGTIAQLSGHHFIGGDIGISHTEYPDSDFIILEGGTNDADTLHEEGLGTYSESDFGGSYDTTTFSGAFETMLYKAVTYFPHAHIGYIVAQKMGTGAQAARRKTFFDRAVALCGKWGIPVLNLWTGTRLNPSISVQWDSSKDNQANIDAGSLYTDGQHLTPSGYDLITPIIEQWMRGI